MQANANGLTIEYEVAGSENAPVILLIMGLGAQLVRWPQALVDGLAGGGYRVVCLDNRDCGRSSSIDNGGVPEPEAILSGTQSASYSLDDMALDVVGLMDALAVDKAHIVGASMGGMIAQLLASDHPDRVLSLTCIMSTTGNPDLSPSDPEVFAKLMEPRPDPHEDFGAYLEHEVWRAGLLSGSAHPKPADEVRSYVRAEFERGYNPAGVARQMAAIFSAPERREKLRTLNLPTLIVHGTDDPLIPPDGGEDIATTIPGARLALIPGMGHDLPSELMPVLQKAILDLIDDR